MLTLRNIKMEQNLTYILLLTPSACSLVSYLVCLCFFSPPTDLPRQCRAASLASHSSPLHARCGIAHYFPHTHCGASLSGLCCSCSPFLPKNSRSTHSSTLSDSSTTSFAKASPMILVELFYFYTHSSNPYLIMK